MMFIYGTIVSDIGSFLGQGTGNPWAGIQSLNILIPALFNLALIAATVILFFMLLSGGIKWITAGGDKEAVGSAQKTLTAAIIGIVIVLSAWAIKNLVWNFFGLNGSGGSGAPSTTQTTSKNCLDTCKETSCQQYRSFCYKDCRCICDGQGKMWYYDNPWCDADTHQYVCKNSSKTPDKNGLVSKTNKNCSGDKQN